MPVPEGIVADEVHRHLEGEGRLEDDEHRAEVDAEARKAFKQQLLLDAVAEKVQVQVAQNELIEYIVSSAQQYGMDPNAFAKAVDEAGQVPAMVAEVARRKALANVLEKAAVTDASGNAVDLSSLFVDEGDDLLGGDQSGDAPGEAGEVPTASAPVAAASDPTALPTIAVADFEPDDAKA